MVGNKKINGDESFLPVGDDKTNGFGLKVPLIVFPNKTLSVSPDSSGLFGETIFILSFF